MAYDDMKKDELIAEAEERGLDTSGTKDDLVARLELNDVESQDDTASQEEIVAAQEKDTSGQRDEEKNPVANAAAGDPAESQTVSEEEQAAETDKGSFRNAAVQNRKRIDESWDEPEPFEVDREQTPGEPDYRLLPDGRKQKLVFKSES